jgi:orotidine-5'-phosphate decarboxylase
LLAPKVAILKPQLAFFGDDWAAPTRFAPAIREGGSLLLADAKRGDIGSTAQAYAERILGDGGPCDAVTLNPYLGGDSLEPWIELATTHGRGLFVLVKTSNPGSADLQDLRVEGGDTICEHVARLVDRVGADAVGERGRSLVGAVVGLTAPVDLIRRLRELMPRAFFLMPGYGAQGGSPAAFEAALDAQGGGVIVSASRSLTHPWKGPAPDDWPARVDAALVAMRDDLAR